MDGCKERIATIWNFWGRYETLVVKMVGIMVITWMDNLLGNWPNRMRLETQLACMKILDGGWFWFIQFLPYFLSHALVNRSHVCFTPSCANARWASKIAFAYQQANITRALLNLCDELEYSVKLTKRTLTHPIGQPNETISIKPKYKTQPQHIRLKSQQYW